MTAGSHPRRRRSASPGELRPLEPSLGSESRALAEALRDVFRMLNTSVGEFAASCHRDKGAVSRYLSGKRIPPQEFIDALLNEALRLRGEAGVPAELAGTLRKLHLSALEGHDPHQAKLQRLEDEVRLYASRRKALEDDLVQSRREIDQLRHQARTEKSRERETIEIVEDLERQLREASDERRKAEMRLAMVQAAGRANRADKGNMELGILGCPV
jgi:transcriptional regulator with XRE-family HTH domain